MIHKTEPKTQPVGEARNDLVVRHLLDIDTDLASADEEQRVLTQLAIAADLCERCAFRNAMRWPAERVAKLIMLAAEIERFAHKLPAPVE